MASQSQSQSHIIKQESHPTHQARSTFEDMNHVVLGSHSTYISGGRDDDDDRELHGTF
jgi:hypothetical protein